MEFSSYRVKKLLPREIAWEFFCKIRLNLKLRNEEMSNNKKYAKRKNTNTFNADMDLIRIGRFTGIIGFPEFCNAVYYIREAEH